MQFDGLLLYGLCSRSPRTSGQYRSILLLPASPQKYIMHSRVVVVVFTHVDGSFVSIFLQKGGGGIMLEKRANKQKYIDVSCDIPRDKCIFKNVTTEVRSIAYISLILLLAFAYPMSLEARPRFELNLMKKMVSVMSGPAGTALANCIRQSMTISAPPNTRANCA